MYLRPLMFLLMNFGAFSFTTRNGLNLLGDKGSLVFLSSPAEHIPSTGAHIYAQTYSLYYYECFYSRDIYQYH